jgi:hypothetical protein
MLQHRAAVDPMLLDLYVTAPFAQQLSFLSMFPLLPMAGTLLGPGVRQPQVGPPPP